MGFGPKSAQSMSSTPLFSSFLGLADEPDQLVGAPPLLLGKRDPDASGSTESRVAALRSVVARVGVAVRLCCAGGDDGKGSTVR